MARTTSLVLEAAAELLAEEGPEAVTHVRVAERTGLARTTIYRHWPDQASLLAAVLEEAPVESSHVDTGDLRADLVELLTRLRRRLASRRRGPAITTLISRAEHDRRFAELHHSRMASRMAPIRDRLVSAVENGELDRSTKVDQAVALLVGPLVYQRLFTGQPATDELLADAVDQFVAAHGPGGRAT